MDLLDARALRVALALAIGLLIGTERERRRGEEGYAAFAGIRTFGLIGMLGGLCAYLAIVPLIVVGAACVGLLAMVAYVVNRDRADRGLTTEVAMVVTYALGLTAERSPAVAAAGAVLMTVVLALRSSLHRAVREVVSAAELRAALLFLVCSLVVLPLTPDVRVGPYAAIHPPSLVRLVVLLMFINGAGHVAQRVLGPRFGLTVAGFAGGFVSSSATIASMSARAKERPEAYKSAVSGALASCVATGVQFMVIVATIEARLLRVVAPALAIGMVIAALGTAAFALRPGDEVAAASAPDKPFRLSAALIFAGIYCALGIVSSALHERLGAAGIVLASAAAGLVDAHSTAGAIASLHLAGELGPDEALLATLSALSTNSATKVVLAWSGRNVPFGVFTTAGVLLIALGSWASLWLR